MNSMLSAILPIKNLSYTYNFPQSETKQQSASSHTPYISKLTSLQFKTFLN